MPLHCCLPLANTQEPVIGTFSFHSAKQVQGRCSAYMFALHVAEELDVWPEGMERERCWVSCCCRMLRAAVFVAALCSARLVHLVAAIAAAFVPTLCNGTACCSGRRCKDFITLTP